MGRVLERPQMNRYNAPKRNRFRYLLPALALATSVAVVGSYFAIRSVLNVEKEEHYVMDNRNSPIANEKLIRILTKQLRTARTEFIDLSSTEQPTEITEAPPSQIATGQPKPSTEQTSTLQKVLASEQLEKLRETNFRVGKRRVGVGTSTYQFLIDYDIYSGYGTVNEINENGVLMEITAEDGSESHEVLIPYGTAFHLSLIIEEDDLRGYLMLPMKFRRLEESDHVLVIPSCASHATLSVTGAERITWRYPSCGQ